MRDKYKRTFRAASASSPDIIPMPPAAATLSARLSADPATGGSEPAADDPAKTVKLKQPEAATAAAGPVMPEKAEPEVWKWGGDRRTSGTETRGRLFSNRGRVAEDKASVAGEAEGSDI